MEGKRFTGLRARGARIGIRAILSALTVAGLLAVAGPAAEAAEVCNAEEFCVDESFALTSDPPGMIAGAPLDVFLSVENSSTPLDREHWMSAVTVVLDDEASEADPPLTKSVSLPDGLILAGGGTCAPPTYSGCAGGNGTFVSREILFGTPVGESTGAFGIERIVNINPPAPGAWAHYELKIKLCKVSGGGCNPLPDSDIDVEIPPDAASELTIPTEIVQSFPPLTVEFSLTSLIFRLDGQSDQIEGKAPAPEPFTVVAVPRECGPVAGTSTYDSRESGTVSIPHDFSVTGCPTAALAPFGRSGTAIHLDGSPSTTPVSGREITRWHWDFGDGSDAVTSTPTVSHDYEPGSEHTVSLVAEDSAGARSTPTTQTVELPAGTALSVTVSGPGTVGGGAGGVEGDAISCPPACSAIYPPGASTSLSATPSGGFLFAGWGGDCSGTGQCALTMSADRDVTATFEAPPPPPTAATVTAPAQPTPDTRLKRASIRGRVASFAFRALGASDGFQCALTRATKRAKAKFAKCRSPKVYRGLRPGRFLFQVRAIGVGGPDPTPAKKRFTIKS